MSRIERTRVDSGDTTSATELNNTYSDYSQAAALDANNTRDQAFDIPHFTNTPIVLNSKESQLGNANMHITAGTITSVTSTTDLAALLDHQIQTAGALATFLNLSAAPWSLVSGDVFRLWWDLSVSPTYTGTPWRHASAQGQYTIPKSVGAGSYTITDGMHCWVMYLEWDITSAALSTWVTVPDQTGFASTFGSDKGGYLYKTPATSTVGAWSVYSFGFATEGKTPDPTAGNNEEHNEHGYYAVSGMWAYPATGAVTVYGVRVKLTGILHPSHLAAGNNENLLLYDINAAGGLSYSGGRISAVHMRGS